MYAITGITGKVGGAAARALLAAHKVVRAIVRDPSKGKPWADRGCEIAIADLDSAERLARAFDGAEGVFAMLPSTFDPTPGFPEAKEMIGSLRRALEVAAPSKVVVLSTIGADVTRPNLLNQLGLLEQGLADLTMPVTYLRPAWFMENAAWDVAPARATGVIRSYLQPLDRPVPMIAAEDVGRTVAALLQQTWDGHRVVELEGPQRVSPQDVAAAFTRALGHPVRAEAVPQSQWEDIFRAEGMKNPTPRAQMIDGFNAGWIDYPDRGSSARKGTITIDQAIAALVREAQ